MSTSTPSPGPVVRADHDGDRRWFFGGGVHTWKVRAVESNGAFLLFEDQMAGGKMTPLHTHPDSDETMYMLEGEIRMHLDGQEHRVAAGGVVVAPRGVPQPSWSCRTPPGCCACTRPGAVKRSTGMPASRPPPTRPLPALWTSTVSEPPPSTTVGST